MQVPNRKKAPFYKSRFQLFYEKNLSGLPNPGWSEKNGAGPVQNVLQQKSGPVCFVMKYSYANECLFGIGQISGEERDQSFIQSFDSGRILSVEIVRMAEVADRDNSGIKGIGSRL